MTVSIRSLPWVLSYAIQAFATFPCVYLCSSDIFFRKFTELITRQSNMTILHISPSLPIKVSSSNCSFLMNDAHSTITLVNNNASIHDVVSSPHQFAFSENTPVDETLLNLAYDVLERWNSEKNGETNVGRVLPESYLWFEGHSGHNYFRNRYDGDFTVWSYSLESPYES